jgi:cupin superfamily acireductone dioxygenase involved in methionine salvage
MEKIEQENSMKSLRIMTSMEEYVAQYHRNPLLTMLSAYMQLIEED